MTQSASCCSLLSSVESGIPEHCHILQTVEGQGFRNFHFRYGYLNQSQKDNEEIYLYVKSLVEQDCFLLFLNRQFSKGLRTLFCLLELGSERVKEAMLMLNQFQCKSFNCWRLDQSLLNIHQFLYSFHRLY